MRVEIRRIFPYNRDIAVFKEDKKMSETRENKHTDNIARIVSVALCAVVFASTLFVYPHNAPKDDSVTALADANQKDFKWEKKAVGSGTTVDADYLWPEESNPVFTAVFRDGEQLSEDKMVTITPGSVYHFRGMSDDSVLYTQVYVGSVSGIDVTSGETGTWYRLLPGAIRTEFENAGWAWETGWEYSGRAYLDSENKRIMVKANDNTAVLYGIGLYLNDKNNYNSDSAFEQEGGTFVSIFGDTEDPFASALECYYTRGGELRSRCPKIYAMVADVMGQLDNETAQIRDNTETDTSSETQSQEAPGLMGDLLEYVNVQREEAGLGQVVWDEADDANAVIRVGEIRDLFSQTRPDGSDAFSAYTEAVMCEMRVEDAQTAEEIFDCASSYFMMPELTSFTCAVYGNIAVIAFVW